MTRIQTFLIAAGLLITASATGQTHVEAQKLLNEVRQNTRSYKDQYIQFSHTIETPTGDENEPMSKRESSGVLKVVGDNYLLEIQGQTVILNGNKAYVISPEDEEINVQELDEEDRSYTPGGILAQMDKGVSLALAGEEQVDGKRIVYVKMRPNASETVRDMIIGVDMTTKRIHSYQEIGTNNTITTLKIIKYEVNQGLSPDVVTFNRADYAGWRINEPRNK